MPVGRSKSGDKRGSELSQTQLADEALDKTQAAPVGGLDQTAPSQDPRTPPATKEDHAAQSKLGFARGDALGRYVVLDLLGRGGMGEVYSAYDPELDRKVALKVLRPSLGRGTSLTSARAQLTQEAQAMAKLAHPNVIQVFDVGTVEGDVYVAMEFVDGSSLRAWLKEERDTDAILGVFRSAALGLAAAHKAGLVHRDFKPDNVLVGNDGRVRVIDFGIASLGTSNVEDADDIIAEFSRSKVGQSDTQTTLLGVAAGTPAYMAPEQFSAQACDERTDQFSFAVALHEALCGSTPFQGGNIAELSTNVIEGNRRPMPDSSEIAPWMESAIARSLKPDPDDRYNSMQALLDALSPRQSWMSRHRLHLSMAAIIGAGLLLALLVLPSDSEKEACHGEEALLAGIWDAQRAGEVQKHFATSSLPYAKKTADNVVEQLNAHSDNWKLARNQICVAAQRKDLSEELKLRGMFCLDRRLRELDAIGTILNEGSDDIIKNAPVIVSGLSPIADCSNTTLLSTAGDAPPPLWQEIEDMLPELKVMFGASQHAKLIERADELRKLAQKRGYAIGEGKALNWMATGERALSKSDAAEEHFFEAIRIAQKHGAPRIAAVAWEGLMGVAASNDQIDAGIRWQKHAELANEQAGVIPALQARITYLHGFLLYKKKEYEEALAQFLASSALYEKIFGPLHFRVTASLALASASLRRLNRLDEAIAMSDRALKIATISLGPDHPRLASMHNSAANTRGKLHDFEKAREHYTNAKRLAASTHGERSATVAMYLYNEGLLELRAAKPAVALTLIERALDLRKEFLGPGHAGVARTLGVLAKAHFRLGDLSQAIEVQSDAVNRYHLLYGDDHVAGANAQIAMCHYLRRAKELKKAQAACQKSLVVLDPDTPDKRDLAEALTHTAWVKVDMGNAAEALKLAQRAWLLREEHAGDSHLRGQTRFVLALALEATGEPAKAREHALLAKQEIQDGEPGAAFDLPAIDALLAKTAP